MNAPIHIRNARILDPATGRSETGDLYICDGLIATPPPRLPSDTLVINAAGLGAAPGFIDLHVHLREPGGEEAETIESGSRAAARGGFTTIVAMPNTRPPCDTPARVAHVRQRGDEVGLVRVLPAAAITKGRAGADVADLAQLAQAGAVAFTDDGSTVQSDEVMEQAMRAAREADRPIMDHAQDRLLEQQGGVMHDGSYSAKFNLPGIPSWAEEKTVRRDIELAARTGCALHIQHVTTKEAVALIRAAHARGVRVTGEATPHHLTLSDADVNPRDPNFKMNPPLRGAGDRQALIEAVVDGTLSCLATDHAPHTAAKKALGFLQAPFGIVGLETAIGITYTALVVSGLMDDLSWVRRWTTGPAAVLNMPAPTLEIGAPADLVVMDLRNSWQINPATFSSRSSNTPFAGRTVTGRAVCTIHGGRITWRENRHG